MNDIQKRPFDRTNRSSIIFPNILLVPALSVLCAVVKLCGGCPSRDWLDALLIVPVCVYLLMSVPQIVCVVLIMLRRPK